MAAALISAFPQLASLVDMADVDSRQDWQRRYGLKIPVLLDGAEGASVCVTHFDAEAVAEWITDRGSIRAEFL